jgi:hypothetical protein
MVGWVMQTASLTLSSMTDISEARLIRSCYMHVQNWGEGHCQKQKKGFHHPNGILGMPAKPEAVNEPLQWLNPTVEIV